MIKQLHPPPFSRRVSDFHIGNDTNYTEFESNGRMILHGTARAENCLWMSAGGLKAPGTKPATYVTLGLDGAWEFSDNTDDTVGANIRLPGRMDLTVAPCAKIKWSSPTADPGNNSRRCVWQIESLWIAEDESTIGAAQETLKTTTTASTVANGLVSSCINLCLPEAGDIGLIVRIKRLGADPADTLGDVVHGLGFCLHFTRDKMGLAT